MTRSSPPPPPTLPFVAVSTTGALWDPHAWEVLAGASTPALARHLGLRTIQSSRAGDEALTLNLRVYAHALAQRRFGSYYAVMLRRFWTETPDVRVLHETT